MDIRKFLKEKREVSGQLKEQSKNNPKKSEQSQRSYFVVFSGVFDKELDDSGCQNIYFTTSQPG